MREAAHVALLVALMLAGTAQTATGADPQATSEDATPGAGSAADPTFGEPPRERLTDLLFSDDIDRIDTVSFRFRHGFAISIQDLGMDVDFVEWDLAHVIQAR